MFCSKCGTQNPDEANFCVKCGAPLNASAAQAVAAIPTIHYAGFWRRWVAYVIDSLILTIPNGLFASIIGLRVLSLFRWVDGVPEFDFGAIGAIISTAIWVAVIAFLTRLFYYSLFESSKYRATPGKMALGIVVTDMNGGQISLTRAIGRNLGKIISSLILSIGYIMAGITPKKQALHDMMAECLVVMR